MAQYNVFLPPKIILVFTIFGTALTSLYFITLCKGQVKERGKAKSLLGMYITVIVISLFFNDIAMFMKTYI
ncbi:hypothetical protein COK27_02830 [Bacillus thuringiensis]|nr:hypothetical protein COK27_02830 [Bacillus thuringiensis]PGL22675.1 hypothetical protein CN921_20210 [Bacillus thuringiensis]